MFLRLLAIFACVPFLAACGPSTSTQVFEVEIVNLTNQPLSAGLVKNGPPRQEQWLAPHEIMTYAAPLSDRKWGAMVPPGETRLIGPQEGEFAAGSVAVLRIYQGNLTVEQANVVSRDDPDRVDVYLWPGRSSWVISDRTGRLTARRADQ